MLTRCPAACAVLRVQQQQPCGMSARANMLTQCNDPSACMGRQAVLRLRRCVRGQAGARWWRKVSVPPRYPAGFCGPVAVADMLGPRLTGVGWGCGTQTVRPASWDPTATAEGRFEVMGAGLPSTKVQGVQGCRSLFLRVLI